jgi:hypothetical protein
MRIRRRRTQRDPRPSATDQEGTTGTDRQDWWTFTKRVLPRRSRAGAMRRHPTGDTTLMWRKGLDKD